MKLNCILLLATFLITVIFISGCIVPKGIGKQTTASNDAGTPSTVTPETNKKINTVINPARDLTGEWEGLSGSAKWRNNVANWACSYEGFFHLTLNQNENALTGTFTSTITKVIPAEWNNGKVPCSLPGKQLSSPLTGIVSSAGFKFTVVNIDFVGTYTTDTVKGTFESCPDQICSDGTRGTGSIGEFKLARQS